MVSQVLHLQVLDYLQQKGPILIRKDKPPSMQMIAHVWKLKNESIPTEVWDAIESLIIDTRMFSKDEFAQALHFTTVAVKNGVPVKELCIVAHRLSTEQCVALCKLAPYLRCLWFVYCKLSAEFVDRMTRTIRSHPKRKFLLEGMFFIGCKLEEAHITRVVDCIKYIRAFYIADNKLNERSTKHLVDVIVETGTAKGTPIFDWFGLHCCDLDDLCMKEVSRVSTLIRALSVNISDSPNKISDRGIQFLMQSVVKGTIAAAKAKKKLKLESMVFSFDLEDMEITKQLSKCFSFVSNLALGHHDKLSAKCIDMMTYELLENKKKYKDIRLKSLWINKVSLPQWKEALNQRLGEHGIKLMNYEIYPDSK